MKWFNVQIADHTPGSKPLAYFRVCADTKEEAQEKAEKAIRVIVWEV